LNVLRFAWLPIALVLAAADARSRKRRSRRHPQRPQRPPQVAPARRARPDERLGRCHQSEALHPPGHVELHDPQNKTDLYADLVEFFEDENRAVATGNVVLSQGTNRIAAERAEFNTKTMLGTFFNASGIARCSRRSRRRVPASPCRR